VRTGSHFDVEWFDRKREPQCPPDPNYPNGIDLDSTFGNEPSCKIQLEYPAPRCGYYLIHCELCGLRAIATTAGRADDPRSIKLRCHETLAHPYAV
jgi:hypothetical protein